jgi:hypothetical protein
MALRFSNAAAAFVLAATGALAAAAADTVPVTVDNFVRAETDLYFGGVVKDYGFGNSASIARQRQSISRPSFA